MALNLLRHEAKRRAAWREEAAAGSAKRAEYFREYRRANREHLNEKNRRWKEAHPGVVDAAYQRRWCAAHLPMYLVSAARKRAAKSGLPCTITAADIHVPEFCPVLPWIRLESAIGTGKASPASPSIDRIKPELGYVAGNVRVISHRANALRRDGTAAELELVAADARRLEGGCDG